MLLAEQRGAAEHSGHIGFISSSRIRKSNTKLANCESKLRTHHVTAPTVNFIYVITSSLSLSPSLSLSISSALHARSFSRHSCAANEYLRREPGYAASSKMHLALHRHAALSLSLSLFSIPVSFLWSISSGLPVRFEFVQNRPCATFSRDFHKSTTVSIPSEYRNRT